MNNAQTSTIIKELCQKQNVTISKMLAETSIRKSLIYDMEKRDYTPSAEILEKIADYLKCSVDYLLGRVDTPNGTYSINNHNTTVNGTQANVINNNTAPEKPDNITEQFFEKFETLSFEEKVDTMQYVNKNYKK